MKLTTENYKALQEEINQLEEDKIYLNNLVDKLENKLAIATKFIDEVAEGFLDGQEAWKKAKAAKKEIDK